MIKVWWSKGPKPGNYGDILTPYILDFCQTKYTWVREDFDHLFIGSIARFAKSNTYVFGSGFIDSKDYAEPNALYLSVRGPRTYKKLVEAGAKPGKNIWDTFGDPAFLLPLFVGESQKKHDIGIVPHYVDYEYVKNKYPNEKVINLLDPDPIKVCKEITSCRKIISSSLHGIITGHAYGIPSAWVKFSDKLYGDDFKFHDHFEAIGLEGISSEMTCPYFTTGTVDIEDLKQTFLDNL